MSCAHALIERDKYMCDDHTCRFVYSFLWSRMSRTAICNDQQLLTIISIASGDSKTNAIETFVSKDVAWPKKTTPCIELRGHVHSSRAMKFSFTVLFIPIWRTQTACGHNPWSCFPVCAVASFHEVWWRSINVEPIHSTIWWVLWLPVFEL